MGRQELDLLEEEQVEELQLPQEPSRRTFLKFVALSTFSSSVASALLAACRPASTAPSEPVIGATSSSPRSPEQLGIFPNLEEDWEGNRFTTVKTADGIEKKIWLMGKDTKWKEIEKPLGQVFRFLTEDINPGLVFYNIKFHGKHTEGYANLFPPGSYDREQNYNKTFMGISAGTFNEYESTYNGKTTKGRLGSGDIFAAQNDRGDITFILSEFQGRFANMQRQPQFTLASAPIYGPQIVNLPPGIPNNWEQERRVYSWLNQGTKPMTSDYTWFVLRWQNPDGTSGQISYRHQPGTLKYHTNIWKFFAPLPYDDIPLI